MVAVKERTKMLSLIYVSCVILGSFIKVSQVGGTNQIGYDGNKKSGIRKSREGYPNIIELHSEVGMLSPEEWRSYWIRIYPDGSSIEVGRNGSRYHFMFLKTEPKTIKYYGFTSWYNKASWAYLCPQKNNTAENPCTPNPCGPNSECRLVNHFAACSCQKNYIGVPPECKAECNTDSECAQDQACIVQKCQNSCVTASCGQNAKCLVFNHTRTCNCLPGFTGDPLVKCIEEEQPDENCRNIWITHDYKYEHFFPITKRDNNTIELKFKVKANRDANMVFTQNMYPIHGDPAYEMVLGGWNNTRSVIRRTRYHPDAVIETGEIAQVSPNEWLEFWVKIEANTMEVGRKGKRAFMVLKDLKEMPIKYYSIAGWGNATVLWSLPCVDEKDFS